MINICKSEIHNFISTHTLNDVKTFLLATCMQEYKNYMNENINSFEKTSTLVNLTTFFRAELIRVLSFTYTNLQVLIIHFQHSMIFRLVLIKKNPYL